MQREIVQNLPKIELHCHLDGSVRPAVLEKIARKQKRPLPAIGDALAELMKVPDEAESLLDYLKCFDVVLPYLQQKEALELIAYDLVAQVAEENVTYLEVRFAPMLFTHEGLSIETILDVVLSGLKKGEEDFGVKTNALLCGMRHHTLEQNQQIVTAAKKYLGKGVAGFDLAGDEANYPMSLFEEVVSEAHTQQIPITLHAGECGCAQNVATAVKLGATRIGHGIALKDDSAILESCIRHNTLIEMCPTSNFQTKAVSSLSEYPFQIFLDAGLNICINTDNRTVSNTTLTDEFLKLHEWYQIDYALMKKLNQNAIEGAFISDSDKQHLSEQLDTAYLPVLHSQ